MLVKLTRNRRMKAGWFVTLTYLLCIMAPTLSYALPGERVVVPCMTMESVMPGAMVIHDETVDSMQAHVEGQSHDHSSAHAMAMADDDDPSVMPAAMDGDGSSSKKASHSAGGQCCAQMCVSAMPASLTEFAMPSIPTSVVVAAGHRAMADNAPAVHYRPPIA